MTDQQAAHYPGRNAKQVGCDFAGLRASDPPGLGKPRARGRSAARCDLEVHDVDNSPQAFRNSS